MGDVTADEYGGLDLFVPGVVFLDIIFTGLSGLPGPGTETWAPGMGSSPGGIANLAVAARRLGLVTGLGTALGDDLYGDFCREVLSTQEGVDLSASRRIDGWHSPVTVSLAYDRDRSMITHGHPLPVGPDGLVGGLPVTRSAYLSLTGESAPWVRQAREAGALLFAGIAWDDSARWAPPVLDALADCHAFLLNAAEATHFSRTDTPRDALRRLADRVPLLVVTLGGDGVIAVDSGTGELAEAPGIPVAALDPTGAGDVFAAGFIAATLWDMSLSDRVAFANLVAALSVRHFGGSLSAPGWGDIADWWAAVRLRAARHHDAADEVATARRYRFLDDLIPHGTLPALRRATATISRLAEAA